MLDSTGQCWRNRYMRKPGSKVEGFGGRMLGAAFINVRKS